MLGHEAAGVVAELGLTERVAIQMGTLGKALGGFGAYVAGSKALRELLINRCRSFIFTTSLPPAVMAMGMAAIDLVMLALQLGATYVARSFSGDKAQLIPLIKAAISTHRNIRC